MSVFGGYDGFVDEEEPGTAPQALDDVHHQQQDTHRRHERAERDQRVDRALDAVRYVADFGRPIAGPVSESTVSKPRPRRSV